MSETAQMAHAMEKLQAIGVDPRIAAVIYGASTIDEVNERIPGSGVMGDATQILMYTIQSLYQFNAHTIVQAEETLTPLARELGLPETFVAEYLTKMGDYPNFAFEARYGDRVSFEDRKRFSEKAKQFILTAVREYLES